MESFVFAQRYGKSGTFYRTIPQSEIEDFCQPPLHKGAFEVLCKPVNNNLSDQP